MTLGGRGGEDRASLKFMQTHGYKKDLLLLGGFETVERLAVPEFRRGIRGCVSDLSVGKLFSIEMVLKARRGQNVERCTENNLTNNTT